MNLHDEARIKKIIRPLPAPGNARGYPEWVDSTSPRWVRPRLVQIRRYLGMECGVGMGWDNSDEGWANTRIRTLVNDEGDLIGCIAFDTADDPVLEFVWIHPFYRNQGVLQRAWPEIVARFGKFYVSEPVSPAMQRFLEKQATA